MGYSYILLPVDNQLRDWGQKCSVPLPSDIPDGRFPTLDELIAVVKTIPGYGLEDRRDKTGFSLSLKSFEQVEIDQSTVKEEFRGLWKTMVKSYVDVEGCLEIDEQERISFHGDPFPMLTIIQRLFTKCGPLVFLATCDGDPWFVLSSDESRAPIGPAGDEWIIEPQ